MICQACKAERRKSSIMAGATMGTLLCLDSFHDEDGKHHSHDWNTYTTQYECSNGHVWTDIRTGSCWCGWPDSGMFHVEHEGEG